MDSTQGSIKYQRQSSFTSDSSESVSQSVGVGTGTEETYSEMGQSQLWEQRNDHPLFNDVILSKLFEFMGGKDLKACRLVCKKWCMSSLPSARSKFTLKLQGTAEEMTRKLRDFVQVFRENKLGIPFVKYYLNPFSTTEGSGQEFLQICGSTAKTVTFTLMQEKSQLSLVKVEDISELLKAMPNISFFSISDLIHTRSGNVVRLFSDDSNSKPTLNFLEKFVITHKEPIPNNGSDIDYCPTFIEELLSVAPNISDFRVSDSSSNPDRSTISQVVKAIEKFDRASVITNLKFFNAKIEHFESLQRLAEIGLKLKSLDFQLGLEGLFEQRKGSVKSLPQMATLFKNSIERLRVNGDCSNFIQLPHMPKLERLELDISRDFDSKCVNLNKLFPALKELELYFDRSYDEDEYVWEEFLPNSEPCPNVKSLTLWHFFFKSQFVDHILNIFPTLTKLDLDFKTDDEEILRKIMTQMPQLEDLSLNGTIEGIESIDVLLTGIPFTFQTLEHVVMDLKEMTVQLRAETIRHYRDRYCRFPSISNLTNLKRLYLDITGGDEFEDDPTMVTRLTDVFVFFGLYSMKHLNKLEIEDCEFTKSGCEILTTEMGLEAWTFRDMDCLDIIPRSPMKLHRQDTQCVETQLKNFSLEMQD